VLLAALPGRHVRIGDVQHADRRRTGGKGCRRDLTNGVEVTFDPDAPYGAGGADRSHRAERDEGGVGAQGQSLTHATVTVEPGGADPGPGTWAATSSPPLQPGPLTSKPASSRAFFACEYLSPTTFGTLTAGAFPVLGVIVTVVPVGT